MTPKQLKLLSNLAEGSNISSALVKGVVSAFRYRDCVFGPAHVIGSMLQQLAKHGYCYHTKLNNSKAKYWHITELGFNTMLNELAEELQP